MNVLNYVLCLTRPDDSTILVSFACGSLSGIASSTGGQVLMSIKFLFYNLKHICSIS